MKCSRIAFAMAIGVVAACVTFTNASAHARYKSSTPTKGEVLQTAPLRVDVYVTEDIRKVSGTYGLDVQNDAGKSVTAGATTLDESDRSKMSVTLQAALPPGRYVVLWNDVSDDDGDPANGAFSFYVQSQPTAADLQKDQALEAIGAEELTPEANTPTASVSAGATTAGAASPAITPTAKSVDSTKSDDDTGRNVMIIVAVAAAVLAIGGGVAYAMRNRKRP